MEKILITDKIYGKVLITDRVLIELINSDPIQRLKKINQFGIPNKYYHLKNYSRYEHSVGVMILLRILGASIEEQIAGLLHDASHTAFSHVYDWVVGSGARENAQDKHQKKYILSNLKTVLEKHSFSAKRIANYKNFKLLERNVPILCADRVDYGFREMDLDSAKKCFQNLTAKDNRIVFKDKKEARIFGEAFLKCQTNHWGGLEAVSRYEIFSTALKIALKEKIISKDDFWTTDDEVINKIVGSNNNEIKRLLKILTNKSLKDFPRKKKVTHKKFRYADPDFLNCSKIVKLSREDKEFRGKLQVAQKENKKGIFPIKF
jgi:uncharacterized protein